ncbi:hypothetical protein RKD23_000252 [Streptomyces sp. SAI-170]
MLAFATTAETGPKTSRTRPAAAARAVGSVMSVSRAGTVPGREAATASRAAFSWPNSATCAPRAAISRAGAVPMPRATPVTTSVRWTSGPLDMGSFCRKYTLLDLFLLGGTTGCAFSAIARRAGHLRGRGQLMGESVAAGSRLEAGEHASSLKAVSAV